MRRLMRLGVKAVYLLYQYITGTKVPILTPIYTHRLVRRLMRLGFKADEIQRAATGPQITCFTGTKVLLLLVQKYLLC